VTGVIGRLVVACVVFGAAIASPRHLVAQGSAVPEGSTGSTWAGVALGGYSGTVLGLIGSMLPCNRTLAGARCTASGASAGAALGVAMGGLVGGQNQDEIVRRAQNAGWGALVGGMAGAALWKSVRQYGWADAMAVAAVGGAIGTAPQGAGLGGAVGATTGAVVWLVTPESGLPNFVMLTMAGVAVGGMLEWALTAGDANRSEPLFTPSFSIPVR
jgi:hypothetical protein